MRDKMVIHCTALNDVNGNARRVYLVINTTNGDVLDAIDEGCEGLAAWRKKHPTAIMGPSIDVTPQEYRNLLKQHS